MNYSKAHLKQNWRFCQKKGETIRIFYGPDAEVEGEIENVYHVINQHDGGHKVILKIRPTF